MWSSKEVFVLSDLHLAAERGQGLFQADAELAACLSWIQSETKDCVIVLAGDVLDYLVIGDDETQKDAEDFSKVGKRTSSIIAHHPEIFDALAALARSPHYQLIVMGGNHDPEFVFPEAQMAFENRIGGTLVNPAVRWLVQGEALRLRTGQAVVSIEHGDILDNWNRVDRDALRSVLSMISRNLIADHDYQLPPGSKLILEATMGLRGSFRWVDFLKPEQEAVIPLIYHFASLKQKKLMLWIIDDYFNMKFTSLRQGIRRRLRPERMYKVKEETSTPRNKYFKKWVEEVKGEKRLTRGGKFHPEKLIERLKQVSAVDNFFELDAPDGLSQDLPLLYENGADLVICGHTHAAKAYRLGRGLYFNTGTWGQLLRLPMSYQSDEDWQQFLEVLKMNQAESFRQPTLAHLKYIPDQKITRAKLLKWQVSEPVSLSAWTFSNQENGWQQEA